MKRRTFLQTLPAATLGAAAAEKTVVLTFDDAVASHRSFVAPLLQELGFPATFFVTHRWMDDGKNFMSWEEIAELHAMGFEIGNHTWTHANFSLPKNAARLEGELALVANELVKRKVPAPTAFAWPGNSFGPEALARLRAAGYRFGRRGERPEVERAAASIGPAYEPGRHHRLLIPTTGNAHPEWTFEIFQQVLSRAEAGKIVVLQFHGAPDQAHPWVHTPPEMFRRYMEYLKEQNFRVLAMRDLAAFVKTESAPEDPTAKMRYPESKAKPLPQPVEVEATRADPDFWRRNMARHRYTPAEVAAVAGEGASRPADPLPGVVLPYPGGRHPRIGFLDGEIDPLRGTKASVFLPWDRDSYAVVDLPEAIFSNLGLLFLAHTHVPTIWNARNEVIENVDWQRAADGSLRSQWVLPNGISFGASAEAREQEVAMRLWLRNGTDQPLSKLRTQICVMLKGANGFRAQTRDNKVLRQPVAAARSEGGDRWILTTWERCGRVWANPPCPCMHSDPVLPDCAPGETVSVNGRLWFYTGRDIEAELARYGSAPAA